MESQEDRATTGNRGEQEIPLEGIDFYASRVTPAVGEIHPGNRAVHYPIRTRWLTKYIGTPYLKKQMGRQVLATPAVPLRGGFLGISQVAKHAFFHCPPPNSLNHCQWPALSSGLLARELHHQPLERRARAAQHGPCQHTDESVQIIPAFLQRPGSTCPMPARIPDRQRLRQDLASASAAALRLDPCRVPCLSFRLSSCACGAASRASP